MKKATLFVIIATVSVLAVVLLGCGGSAISSKDFEGTWVYDDVEVRYSIVLNSDNSGQTYRKIYGMQDEVMEASRPLNWKMNADNSVTIHYELFTGGESDETYELSQDRKALINTSTNDKYKKQ